MIDANNTANKDIFATYLHIRIERLHILIHLKSVGFLKVQTKLALSQSLEWLNSAVRISVSCVCWFFKSHA